MACLRDWLAVPFLDRGRDLNGWDCWGLVFTLSPLVHGFSVPRFDGGYETTAWADAARLSAIIAAELSGFDEGPPGPAHPILTFARFGVRAHCGLALTEKTMLHADNAGRRGGTYLERFDAGEWARPARAVRAFRPKGWAP